MNKKIVYGGVFAAMIFLIVMYIVREKSPAYTLTLEESLKDVLNPTNIVTLAELEKIKADKGDVRHVLVDIRTPYDFVKAHLDKAVNIPFNSMLTEENIVIFKRLKKEKVDVILYGNDQSQANAPFVLLRQMGYLNVRILAGGYTAYSTAVDSLGNRPADNEELARVNYALEMKKAVPQNAAISEQPEKPKQKVVPVIVKKKAAEGGC